MGDYSEHELYAAIEFRPKCVMEKSLSRTYSRKAFEQDVSGGISSVVISGANATKGAVTNAVSTAVGGVGAAMGAGVKAGAAAAGVVGGGAAKIVNVVSSAVPGKRSGGESLVDGMPSEGHPPGAADDADCDDNDKRPRKTDGTTIPAHARITLSYEPHGATDEEGINELFHVLFNTVSQKYHHMHEHGVLCEGALFLLTQALGDAFDCVNKEINAKRVSDFGGRQFRIEIPQAETQIGGLRAGDTGELSKHSTTPSQMVNNAVGATVKTGVSAVSSGVAAVKRLGGSGKGNAMAGLFEPMMIEYWSLAVHLGKMTLWDKLPASMPWLRSFAYGNTRSAVEALWAFAEAHEEILKESPAMERYPKLVQCVEKIVIEVRHDLAAIMELNPRRFFYAKHTLALRVIMNTRQSKLQKFVHEGWVAQKDADGLADALWERIAQVDLFSPYFAGLGHPKQVEPSDAQKQNMAWRDVELAPPRKIQPQESLRDLDYFTKKEERTPGMRDPQAYPHINACAWLEYQRRARGYEPPGLWRKRRATAR